MRLTGAALAAACLAACASAGDPPGGPPDTAPPEIVQVEPDSGHVVDVMPDEVNIVFDEVINERVGAQRPDIANAVIFSPAVGEVRVGWHRRRISVRPREGFQPGRIYRVDVLPVITDLRQNRIRRGRTIVFSTGPAIPTAAMEGAVVDWVAGRPVPNALIEAVLLPDSLPYRWLADSLGGFRVRQLPAGEYLVYGIVDTDNSRRRGTREPYDTVRVQLDSTARLELYAFPRDTLPPRLRSVELADSVTIRLTFDRPLDPLAPLDTTMVRLATEADSTALLPITGVFTARELERQREVEDSVRRAAQPAAPAPAVPAAPRPAVPRPAMPAPRGRPGAGPPIPQDSTPAMRMLARRPPPTDVRLVRLPAPLTPDTRYLVFVEGARSLNGVTGTARAQLRVQRPRVARRDSVERDTVARDTVGRDSVERDTVRRDTVPR